jgi:DNA-directed RNA polymerase subunit RPC12/RpoP
MNTEGQESKRKKCKRCGKEWIAKRAHPMRCAYCKSQYWDKDRIQRGVHKIPGAVTGAAQTSSVTPSVPLLA